jgi:catechol 2,3-dioxygenase-like lactoylglutathione lyase family enzyme
MRAAAIFHEGESLTMSLASYFKGTYGTMYYVTDMAKSVALYKDTFGFKATYESPYWTEFDTGGVSLCLHWTGEGSRSNKTLSPGGVVILKVVKMAELVDKMKAKGVRFTEEPHEVHEGTYSVHYVDLDGNEGSFFGPLT